jgi:hypothetical protein
MLACRVDAIGPAQPRQGVHRIAPGEGLPLAVRICKPLDPDEAPGGRVLILATDGPCEVLAAYRERTSTRGLPIFYGDLLAADCSTVGAFIGDIEVDAIGDKRHGPDRRGCRRAAAGRKVARLGAAPAGGQWLDRSDSDRGQAPVGSRQERRERSGYIGDGARPDRAGAKAAAP